MDKGSREFLDIWAFAKPLNERAISAFYLLAAKYVSGIPAQLVIDGGISSGEIVNIHCMLQ